VIGALSNERLHEVLAALGIARAQLDDAMAPVVAGLGGTRALIAVQSGATLAQLRPDLARLAALSAAGAPAGFFVYTLRPALTDCDTEARMFCPAIGIAEDPVSGNAHAMMAAHLLAMDRMPRRSGAAELTGRQGHLIGRAGRVSVRVLDGAATDSTQVRVGGSGRIVWQATLDPELNIK
jgi:PhzF family phenazine biosynthesis protein